MVAVYWVTILELLFLATKNNFLHLPKMYPYYQLIKVKGQNSENRLFFSHMHISWDTFTTFVICGRPKDCFHVHKNIEADGMGK